MCIRRVSENWQLFVCLGVELNGACIRRLSEEKERVQDGHYEAASQPLSMG